MTTQKRFFTTAASIAFVTLGTLNSVHATQTDNHGLHAVPAPGAVMMDGDLKDWDLSGQSLMCYDIETLRDLYSANVALMYDADNLYVGIHWKSPKPMSNHHDPHYQTTKGWAGDAVQMRFLTDRVAHLTAWYYADKQEPTIQISYGTRDKPFKGPNIQLFQTIGVNLTDGAAMALKKDADGKGYVQEIKIPWKLLAENKTYRPGDSFNLGFELLWGSTDWPDQRYADNLMPGKSSREFFWTAVNDWGPVTLEPKGNLKLPTPDYITKALHPVTEAQAPIALSYTLPRDARVTLAINDAQGRRVRNLVPALPRVKGENTEHWDGLDDNGSAVAPGNYTYRVLYHDPIHANYVMSFANPGKPSWPTSDGSGAFYGDHTPPSSIAAAGDYVGIACPIGEAGQPLITCDLSGQRLWGQANRQAFAGGIQSLATDGKTLWVAAEDTKSYIYRVNIATGLYAPWNLESTDDQGNKYKVLDLKVGTVSLAAPSGLTALAYRDGTLAVCLQKLNKVQMLDSETGAIKREITVNAPKSVAIEPNGTLLVLTEGKLLRINAMGNSTPLTDGTYPDAKSIALDTQGNVYLSVRGTDQNVKVFSHDGRLVREIGKKGGRPAIGAYDAQAMLNPAQIAIDSKGRLWVTEENFNPKRTSIWDTQTGTLVQDLVGTTHYSASGTINPYDPSMGFADNTVYKINLETGEWHPTYSFGQRANPDDLFPPALSAVCRVIKHGTDTYVYTADRTGQVRSVMLRDGQWRSVSCVGKVTKAKDQEHYVDYAAPQFAGHFGEFFAWADQNGDGLVQSDEIAFTKPNKSDSITWDYWGTLPGPDGTIVYKDVPDQSLVKYAITGYTNCGAPTYDLAHPTLVALDQKVLEASEGHMMGGEDGRVYLNQNPLTVVEKTGKVLATYPSRFVSVHGSHNARAAHAGYLVGPSSILGTADMGKDVGEVFAMNGNLGENYLFTQDGLFVQSLFKDLRSPFVTPDKAERGMSMDNGTAGGESFGGSFLHAANGKVYLTQGTTDARVLEITGLETLRRLPMAQFAYTPAQYQQAMAFAQNQVAQTTEPKLYSIARTSSMPTIDGKATEWPELWDDHSLVMAIEDGPDQRYARVAARYDDNALYLGYRVFAPSGTMRNGGQDTHLLFKTGDAVDLMLGPDASAKGAGNLRLLMTVAQGKPIAILNEKVAPSAAASEHYKFAVVWHSVDFDRVVTVPQVTMATSPIDGGYFVEAAIPWTVLGITPKSGLKLRGDVGALFSDGGGQTTVSRQYWSNKATGLVNDVPGEADLTPTLWGTFVLE